MRVHTVEVVFPFAVDLPSGFQYKLERIVMEVCEKYRKDNPSRTMWPSGFGGRPTWREPEEPTFDENVYQISVSEREKGDKKP